MGQWVFKCHIIFSDGRGLLEIDYAIDNEDAIFVIAE